jgi:hypothetical protein
MKQNATSSVISRHEVSWQSRNIFSFPFVSLNLEGLVTIFFAPKRQAFWGPQFEQARKRQRTCHAVVSSLWDTLVFLMFLLGPIKAMLLWARALLDSVVVYNNNFKQVLTLYPRKIKNTSATQMRGFKD